MISDISVLKVIPRIYRVSQVLDSPNDLFYLMNVTLIWNIFLSEMSEWQYLNDVNK